MDTGAQAFIIRQKGKQRAGAPESTNIAIPGHSPREMFDRYNPGDIENTKQANAQPDD